MARVRKPPEDLASIGLEVPEELLHFRHPVWQSVELTERWYLEHLGRPADSVSSFWHRRHNKAVSDWAIHHQVTNGAQSLVPDHRRLREMGISRVAALQLAAPIEVQ